jgi:methionyl-tRNA synthetase
MPVLKVSDNLIKEALEVIRIQITVLGDCPQCEGGNYRGGVCEDCGFISPEVMEAIKEWQQSQGIESKEAFKSLSFVDYFAAPPAGKERKCPRCGRRGFNIQCDNPQCGFEEPPTELNHRRPEFTGVNPDLVKNKKHRFIPSAEHTVKEKIKKQKSKLKKKKEQKEAAKQPPAPDLSNLADVQKDKTTRSNEALQQAALMDFYSPDSNTQSNEEQK